MALLLFCAAYVLPGVFGRDPWKNADVSAFGHMAALSDGRAPWFAPALAGLRAPLARAGATKGEGGRSCCSLHRTTAFSPSRAARALRAGVLAAGFAP